LANFDGSRVSQQIWVRSFPVCFRGHEINYFGAEIGPIFCPFCRVNGPIADTDLEQSNVRFGEKQTVIQIISPAQLLWWLPMPLSMPQVGMNGCAKNVPSRA